MAAGVLLRDPPEVTATDPHTYDTLRVAALDAHIVTVTNSWSGPSGFPFFKVVNLATSGDLATVQAESNSPNGVGVYGVGWNSGTGVSGAGRVGVFGISSDNSWFGIWGRHTGSGPGVAGDSSTGAGILGNSIGGYGGYFMGGKAQLRLAPKSTIGKPSSGSHLKGEIYMDSKGSLFVCTANGTPGTWKKVTMKLV